MTTQATTVKVMPGGWLGMLGGGQLGRMFCHAAQRMGYKVAVLDPDPQSPAGAVADRHICAAYDDRTGLADLAALCPAVSTEFENVPADSLRFLAKVTAVFPSGDAVAIVQDRIQEKAFIRKAGVPVAPYCPVRHADDIRQAPDDLFPGLLKVARLGYDGKGQARVASRDHALQAFAQFDQAECVLEAMLPLDQELSVVMARGQDGQVVTYPSARNEHRDGILAVSTAGNGLYSPALLAQAADAATRIAGQLDYVGVMCVEFFILRDGSLVANEIAPRPHNSGHFTIEACVSSQFEQQARVMAGMPLGSAQLVRPAVMLNILGDIWFHGAGSSPCDPDWAAVLAVPGASLHLYGKAQPRPGRKMGHVTVLGDTLANAAARAAQVAQVLGIPFSP